MVSSRPPKEGRPAPRLYLVTPAAADAAQLRLDLLGALDSADIAAVLMRIPDEDERSLINRVKEIGPIVQRAEAALILDAVIELNATVEA